LKDSILFTTSHWDRNCIIWWFWNISRCTV